MERDLLSLLIKNPSVVIKCLEAGIKSSIFEDEKYALFYKTIMAYFSNYRVIPTEETYTKFLEVLNIDTKLKGMLPIVYVDVMGYTTDKPLEFILDYMLKMYKTRAIKDLLRNQIDNLKPDTIDDASAIINRDISKIRSFGVLEGSEGDFRYCGADALDSYYKAKETGVVGLKYGYPSLDVRTGGQGSGELWIIMGYMKAGKSTMLLNMANNVWHSGKNVVYFSAEVSKKVLDRRLTAMNMYVPINAIKQGTLTHDDEMRMVSFYDEAKKSKSSLYIVDRGAMTTDYIRAKIQELKSIMPVDLVVVDYLGICRTTNCRSNAKEYEYIGQIAWDLRDIAKMENVPVLTAHQSNKEKGISKSIDVGRHCDLLLQIELTDENQLQAGSDLVDMEAIIKLTRDSAGGKFPLEASFSYGIIKEPKRVNASLAFGTGAEEGQSDADSF